MKDIQAQITSAGPKFSFAVTLSEGAQIHLPSDRCHRWHTRGGRVELNGAINRRLPQQGDKIIVTDTEGTFEMVDNKPRFPRAVKFGFVDEMEFEQTRGGRRILMARAVSEEDNQELLCDELAAVLKRYAGRPNAKEIFFEVTLEGVDGWFRCPDLRRFTPEQPKIAPHPQKVADLPPSPAQIRRGHHVLPIFMTFTHDQKTDKLLISAEEGEPMSENVWRATLRDPRDADMAIERKRADLLVCLEMHPNAEPIPRSFRYRRR